MRIHRKGQLTVLLASLMLGGCAALNAPGNAMEAPDSQLDVGRIVAAQDAARERPLPPPPVSMGPAQDAVGTFVLTPIANYLRTDRFVLHNVQIESSGLVIPVASDLRFEVGDCVAVAYENGRASLLRSRRCK